MKIFLFVFAAWISMYFYSSEGITVRRKLGHCQRKGEYKKEIIACDGPCKIRRATARGNVDMVGRAGKRAFTPLLCGRKCFCRGFTKKPKWEKCKKKRGFKIRKQHVSFVLRCKKWSRNVRLTVIGNVKLATKRPTTRKVYVGDIPNASHKIFRVRCNGKCNVKAVNLTANNGAIIDMYVNPRTFWPALAGCTGYFCICKGHPAPSVDGVKQICKMYGNPSNNIIIILLETYSDASNVMLHIGIPNLVSIHPLPPGIRRIVGNEMKDERRFYKINCNGTCDLKSNISINYKPGGTVDVFLSESPILKDIVSCSNPKCICGKPMDKNNTHSTCSMKKEVSSDTFYIMLEVKDASLKEATMTQRIDNFLSLKTFNPVCDCTASGKRCDKDGDCV